MQEVNTIKNLNGFQSNANSFSQSYTKYGGAERSNDINLLEKMNKEYENIINAYEKEN